jgi:hypothetical protein
LRRLFANAFPAHSVFLAQLNFPGEIRRSELTIDCKFVWEVSNGESETKVRLEAGIRRLLTAPH